MNYQLEKFLPPPFPISLAYTENGNGIKFPPESPPVGAAPGAYQKEQHYSRSTIEDTRIRLSIEQALLADEQTIIGMSKCIIEALSEGVIQELHSVPLQYPNIMPHVDKGGTTNLGNNNNSLRDFAFEVFDELHKYYAGMRWADWCIVPYFQQGDDTRQNVHLGVFVPLKFLETVVE